MDFDELVPVYSVKEAVEAEIVKNALHAEGIRASIENENQAGLTGIFDIRILVPAVDHDRARRILEAHERGKLSD
jgi:hypothetical protein